ncbi:hypothetical protein U1Q18_042582 [Sarracenia purpurea var. burkii]
MLDQEAKEEIDSMSTLCLDQLQCMRERHTESITNIRNQAEKCLRNDYLVDQHNSSTSKIKVIAIPSLASIEEMRAAVIGDPMTKLTSENIPNCGRTESKIQQGQPPCFGLSQNRTPFADVN